MKQIVNFEQKSIKDKKIPEMRTGQTVKVHQKIKEGDKERVQVFEGLVIAKKGSVGVNANITVRKLSNGIGVERIFPLYSPNIVKFEIVKTSKVRRAKLYYMRELRGKKTRLATVAAKPGKETKAEAPKKESSKEEKPVEKVEEVKAAK